MAFTTSQIMIAKYYIAAFGRSPDKSGLDYWVGRYEGTIENQSQLDEIGIRNIFFNPDFPEVLERFPAGQSNEDLVRAIYQNVLNRQGDQGGIDYWVSRIEGTNIDGQPKLSTISEMLDHVLGAVTAQNDVATLENKLAFSEYIIETYPNVTFTQEELSAANITDNITVLNQVKLQIDIMAKEENLNNIDFTGDETTKIGLSAQQVSVLTEESSQVIDISDFRTNTAFNGINGSGYSVVILDTGIDLNHQFFGADTNYDGISDRIVYSYDFTNDGDGTVNDVNGHGTNVASIAASSSSVYTGMASEANIIALQVLSNTGQGSFSWLEQALQWVVRNAEAYNIASINMSLGDGANLNNLSSAYGIGDELAALNALGVINIAAAGNEYYSYQSEGASNPSVDPNVVAVGATFDANLGQVRWSSGAIAYTSDVDIITPFSQRGDRVVDIFAPGASITGAAVGGGVSSMTGTSQAAPHIAGIAVLAQQLADDHLGRRLSNAEFTQLLQSSAVTIVDGDNENDNVYNTGDRYYRVDMDALANAILAMPSNNNGGNTPSVQDIEDNITTKGLLSVGSSVSSNIGFVSDKDWFKITLVEGVQYRFDLEANTVNRNPLSDPFLRVHNNLGEFLTSDDDSGLGLNSSLIFTASYSGEYYLSASSYNNSILGEYTLSATQISSYIVDDYSENITTPGIIDSITRPTQQGSIEVSYDKDWFAINLVAGKSYTINLKGNSTLDGTLTNPYIYGVYDSLGILILNTSNDNGGIGYNSQLIYNPTVSGTYFISAGGYGVNTGTYTLEVSEKTLTLDDYSSNINTTGILTSTQSVTGNIETSNDTDWFAITLSENNLYTFNLEGSATSNGTLLDTYIRGIYDKDGILLNGTTDDDSGIGSNSQIVLTVPSSGTYYISAGAFNSYTGTYTLSVQGDLIVDDFSSNVYTLGTLNTNNLSSGNIERIGDIDWFSVSLNSGYTYTFNLLGQTLLDVEIYGLYNAQGNYINNTYNNNLSDATITYTPTTSGTYYLSAKGYLTATGTYNVSMTESVVDDYSNNRYTSGTLSVDSYTSGNIEVINDVDWFSINLTSGYRYDFSTLGTNVFINGIYDSAGSLISGANTTNQLLYDVTSSGRYYVSVSNITNIGEYTLSAQQVFLNDDYSSNTTTTGRLNLGSSVTGDIETHNDTDWFAVSLSANTKYIINLEGTPTSQGTLLDTYLRGIYNSSGVLINGTANDDYLTRNSRVEFTTDASGTYYISAGAYSSYTGTYKLSIDGGFQTIPDVGSSILDHGTITLGQTITNGVIDNYNDHDWYGINLSAGYSYEVQANSLDMNAYITIKNSQGNTLYTYDGVRNNTTSGVDASIIFTPNTSGKYFIDVYGDKQGSYTLNINSGSQKVDDYDSNIITSGILNLGSSVTGSIETRNDIDWFAVSLTANTRYTIDLEGSATSQGTLLDTYLRGIYDSSGNFINGTLDDDSGVGENSKIEFTADSTGTYYISAGSYSIYTGTYKLSINNGVLTDDYSSSITTAGVLNLGSSITGNIETRNDTDWFAVSLTANTRYTIDLEGSRTSKGTLLDTYLRGIYDSSGTFINGTADDDSGIGQNSKIDFTADTTGTYYISAGAFTAYTGSYTLSITDPNQLVEIA